MFVLFLCVVGCSVVLLSLSCHVGVNSVNLSRNASLLTSKNSFCPARPGPASSPYRATARRVPLRDRPDSTDHRVAAVFWKQHLLRQSMASRSAGHAIAPLRIRQNKPARLERDYSVVESRANSSSLCRSVAARFVPDPLMRSEAFFITLNSQWFSVWLS